MSWVIRPIDALDLLCAQLMRDLFAIAKFLFYFSVRLPVWYCVLVSHLFFVLMYTNRITITHMFKAAPTKIYGQATQ